MIFTSFAEVDSYLGSKQIRPFPKGTHTRVIRYDPRRIVIRYHTTDLIVYTPDYIEITPNGWYTPTTKRRINTCVQGQVKSVNGYWYYYEPGSQTGPRLRESLKVAYNGFLWVEPPEPVRERVNVTSLYYTDNNKVWESVYTMAYGDQFEDSIDGLADMIGWTPERAIIQRMKNLFYDLKDKGEVRHTVIFKGIPPTAYNEAAQVITQAFIDTRREAKCMDHGWFCDHGVPDHYVERWLENRGETKPVKLIEKQVKERYYLKLPEETKAKLGQILRPVDQHVTVRISRGCEGKAKEYFHSNSCYWGSYSKSRDYIEHNNGGAVRFYDQNDRLIGRAWYVPYFSNFALFNTYGEGDLQHTGEQAKYLGLALDMPSMTLDADFNKNSDNGFYLNSNRVGLVGALSKRHTINIRLDDPDQLAYALDIRCERCHDRCSEDDTYYIEVEDRTVCSYCCENYYTYIDHGDFNGYYSNDDVVEVELYGKFGTYFESYHSEDGNIVSVDGTYYLYDDDRLVEDVFGNYYLQGSSDYVTLANGDIYPRHRATQNDKGEWVLR